MAINGNNLSEEERAAAIDELGERLKNVREAQNLSLAEIAVTTKIQMRYLKAIEDGDLEQLPKGPYVRGFVRQYCEFLSAADLWVTYDALTAAEPHKQEIKTLEQEQGYTASHKVFRARSHWWIYLVIFVSLATAGWITWSYRGEITGISTSPGSGGTAAVSRDRQAEELSSADAGVSADQGAGTNLGWMDGEETTSAEPAAAASTTPAAIPTGKNVLHIAASGNCWMRVSSGEQTLYSGTLRAGESKTFTVTDRSLKVRYGNSGAVAVTWNGKTTDPLGFGTKPITMNYRRDGSSAAE